MLLNFSIIIKHNIYKNNCNKINLVGTMNKKIILLTLLITTILVVSACTNSQPQNHYATGQAVYPYAAPPSNVQGNAMPMIQGQAGNQPVGSCG